MIVACMMKRDGSVRWRELPEATWMPAYMACTDNPLVEATFVGPTLKDIAKEVNAHNDRWGR